MIRRNRNLIFCLIVISVWNTTVFGQLTMPGNPLNLNYTNSPDIVVYDFEKAISQKYSTFHEDSMMLKPARSGALLDVNIDPRQSGIWDTLDDGRKIWRAGLSVKDAAFLNVIFAPYKLNSGVRIFLYDPEQQNVIGALSDLNNKPFLKLATAGIPGGTIIVEMQVPAYLDNYGDLEIQGLGCDFNDKDGILKRDEWFGFSGPCNEDIVCFNDPLISKLKNSVVRIIFSGNVRCTGTLVNSTRHTSTFILTAGHCFEKEEEANTAVFYFEYESPFCDGPDGNSRKSLSGATIRARNDHVDFALLEVLEPVPFSYQPYYAGWDYSPEIPQTGTVIHHPLGDVKKIAVEDHPLSISSFGSLYDKNSHLMVSHWETGTTEAGSSGAPLFDENGLLRATLTGGLAKCDNPVKDYFQMFSRSWKDYPIYEEQLAVWLDPFKETQGFLEGNDPWEEFRETGDTLSNIAETENVSLENAGLTWGSWSGHNNLETSAFAERFESSAGMISGINLFVRDHYVSRSNRFLNVVIWSGSELPGNVIYRQSVPLENLAPDVLNSIEFDSVVHAGTVFFAGFELFYAPPQDTFSVYMAENRPLSGSSTAYVLNNQQWSNLYDYSAGSVLSSFAIFPVVYGKLPVQNNHSSDEFISIYPNPTAADLRISFREIIEEPVQVTVFNMHGQVVTDKSYGPYQHEIPLNLKGYASGIYIIRVKHNDKVHNLKVAIVKY